MKLSARNQIRGRIESVTRGATQSVVKITVDHPGVLTATITNEAADDLALRQGDGVVAIVKSSEVIVGKP